MLSVYNICVWSWCLLVVMMSFCYSNYCVVIVVCCCCCLMLSVCFSVFSIVCYCWRPLFCVDIIEPLVVMVESIVVIVESIVVNRTIVLVRRC